MPRPVNQRQPLSVSQRVVHAMRDYPLDTDPVDQLIAKAARTASPHEAESYARAALTVAQAICQQQMNQPKRKKPNARR